MFLVLLWMIYVFVSSVVSGWVQGWGSFLWCLYEINSFWWILCSLILYLILIVHLTLVRPDRSSHLNEFRSVRRSFSLKNRKWQADRRLSWKETRPSLPLLSGDPVQTWWTDESNQTGPALCFRSFSSNKSRNGFIHSKKPLFLESC